MAMGRPLFFLVAYDIASTKRRTRVAKILADYGERVNLSVFECECRNRETFERLKARVGKAILAAEDHVRYYFLCRDCREKTAVQGRGALEEAEAVRFV